MPDELTLRDDWYESSSIGLNLNIPIFDGFQRHAKVLQSKYGIEKAMENIRYTEQSIKLDISNYETALKDAVDNIKNEKENLELARGVYANMQLSYRQGTGSFIELVDAENSLREAQNNYFDRMLSLYNARIDLEQASGTLIKFMESIK
jgi:outer membrane protein TolC